MVSELIDFKDIHRLMFILQTIDVGLIVLDRDYRVELWNSFVENHSGLSPENVRGINLFEIFSEIPEQWFKHKTESVFLLENRAFITWEQRPYIFRFKSYRPITGISSARISVSTWPRMTITG